VRDNCGLRNGGRRKGRVVDCVGRVANARKVEDGRGSLQSGVGDIRWQPCSQATVGRLAGTGA